MDVIFLNVLPCREPGISFPVFPKIKSWGSPQSVENVRLFEEKKNKLRSIIDIVNIVKRDHEECSRKLKVKVEKLRELYGVAESLVKQLYEEILHSERKLTGNHVNNV